MTNRIFADYARDGCCLLVGKILRRPWSLREILFIELVFTTWREVVRVHVTHFYQNFGHRVPKISTFALLVDALNFMAMSNAANAAAVVAKLDAKTVPAGKPKKKRVAPLKCAEIRWFLKKDNDSKWIPLRGNAFL